MELVDHDAVGQAELIRRGEVTSRELVDAAIAAAERLNPALNAIVHPRYGRARAEADAADHGERPGPFAGVPILIKDIGCGQADEPMHIGSRLLKNLNFVMDHDSFLARRLGGAGFVSLGRTNLPEFGSIISTESFAYGDCHNPWNLDHSTGGSSGGSAAAVAAGIVPVAHASDGGGSIRIPASECGLVGLKPARGRISVGPDIGEAWAGATTDGVVSRTVRDTAAALDVMCGYESGDPYIAPPFARPLLDEVGADPGRLRIGFLTGASLDRNVHPECVAAVEQAAALLESLGHDVTESAPSELVSDEFSGLFGLIVAASTTAQRDLFQGMIGREITDADWEPHNLLLAEMGTQVSAATYINSVAAMHSWSRRLHGWWHPQDGSRGFDVLVTPVIATPPPKLGHINPANPACMQNVVDTMLFTAQFNSSGQPAMSLPLHWTPDGLPVGVQFVGGFAAEAMLVRLAAQLEQAKPWAQRRPPNFAA